MNEENVFGLKIGEAYRLFGNNLADLLSNLNLEHPDLKSEFISFFLNLAKQNAQAFSFCVEHGLSHPAASLIEGSPKSHFALPSMARVFKDEFRHVARLKKSIVWIEQDSLINAHKTFGLDLPNSFTVFHCSEIEALAEKNRREEMERGFSNVGCKRLATAAKNLASEYSRDELGFTRLSIFRACLILQKIAGSKRYFVAPACKINLPQIALNHIENTEKALGGHPTFDHHLVISHSKEESVSSIDRDFVILGERDGICYFLLYY